MSQFLLYQSEDGRTKLDVRLDDQTVWLSQKQLTDLFGKAKGTISEHIKHIFEDGELAREATVRLFRTVQMEGEREVSREVECYNLDMVLALGFRVRSQTAVRFRLWAAERLKEFIMYLVEQYLIFAQSQAERRLPMSMQDWITKLEGFLTLNDREILTHAGKVSAELAKSHAEREYTEFRREEDRHLESDFDRAIQQLPPPREEP